MLAVRLQHDPPLTWADLCSCLRKPTVRRDDVASEIEISALEQPSPIALQPPRHSAFEQPPKPVNCAILLPPLSTTQLLSHPGQHLSLDSPCLPLNISSLEQDSLQMELLFGNLCAEVYRSLESRGITKESLVACLMGFNCLRKVFGRANKSKFLNQKKKLRKCDSVADVWHIIGEYWSFFAFEMIEQIVDCLGSPADKKSVVHYKDEFAEYATKRIFRTRICSGTRDDSTAMIVKLDSTYDGCELGRLKLFEKRLAKILNLKDGVLELCRIDDGCVELTFLIPSFITDDIFPLILKQELALHRCRVEWLQCVGYHYCTKGQAIEEGSFTSFNTEDALQEDESFLDDIDILEHEPSDTSFLLDRFISTEVISMTAEAQSQTPQMETSEVRFGTDLHVEVTEISRRHFVSLRAYPTRKHGPDSISMVTTFSTVKRSPNESEVLEIPEPTPVVESQMNIDPFIRHSLWEVGSNELCPLENVTDLKLHVAVFNGELIKVQMLVEVLHYSPINFNSEGLTALHTAAAIYWESGYCQVFF